MTFADSIKICFAKYANFTGRAARAEFWWFVLFTFLAGLVISFINRQLAAVFQLAVLLPSLAVGARRLHDTGRTGWWQLIGLIPLLGWIILIIFFVQEGKPEDNPHGANPLASAE